MTAGDEARNAAYQLEKEAAALRLSGDEMYAKAKELETAAYEMKKQATSLDATEKQVQSTLQDIARS